MDITKHTKTTTTQYWNMNGDKEHEQEESAKKLRLFHLNIYLPFIINFILNIMCLLLLFLFIVHLY